MGGSINLLHVLHDGLAMDAKREARLQRREFTPQDLAAWQDEV